MSGETKGTHSLLAKLLVMLMIVNLFQGIVWSPALAEEAASNVQNPQGYVEGTGANEGIKIRKSVKNYDEKTGEFDIQLDVLSDVTETPEKTLDVVLIVDRSASMEKKDRMANAKDAAKEFVSTLLTSSESSRIRVGLVSFAGAGYYAKKVWKETQYVYEYSYKLNTITSMALSQEKDQLNAQIDTYTPYVIPGGTKRGGTFIQAALRQADALLAGSTADLKKIILIGDGMPTFAYNEKGEIIGNGNGLKATNAALDEVQQYTFAEANAIKQKGISITCVGIGIQSEEEEEPG